MCQESITYRMVLLMFFLQLLCVFRVYSIWFLKWNVRIVVIFGSGGPSILLDGKKNHDGWARKHIRKLSSSIV
jgi:hypothetical protein